MSRYTRRPRLENEVFVHVMSRVVQRRMLMDERGKREMGRMLESQAAFAGLQVVTFCFLDNHFHVLVRIDPQTAVKEVGDEELVARFRSLYGSKRSPSLGVNAEMLEAILQQSGERTERIRTRLKSRMGDISVFMREFKTRFTKWYNETYNSVGTFWAERFRSVLVEPGSPALRAVAAYIDLNAVRAGLVEKPDQYAFCGLGLASRGNRKQLAAYGWLARSPLWKSEAPSPYKIFRDYLVYVERIHACTADECVAQTKEPFEKQVVGKALRVDDLLYRGGALGTQSWVQRFCEKRGLMGFLRRRKAKELILHGLQVHVARTEKRTGANAS